MANMGEDLGTDSVPDPPRADPPPDDSRRDDNEQPVKGQRSRKISPSSKQKRCPSGLGSAPKPQTYFNIPESIAPAGASTVISINNSSSVQLGNTISINFVSQAISQPRSSKTPSPETRSMEKPEDVKETCKSTIPVTNEDLDTVTEHVGRRWMKLGEQLGYSDEQMERFQEDNREMGLKEVVYQMLLDWKQSKGPEAHVGILCHSLWNARLHVAAKQLAAQHSGKSL